jgi:hypothetical protein
MQKIISLFQRNYDGDRKVRNEVTPGAEWVLAGEGVATRKFDGTCCLIRARKLFKRYEIKPGKKAPVNFEAASEIDSATGKQQGWLPVGDGPEDQWHREAFKPTRYTEDGTYELCGPRVQGNPDHFTRHELVRHGEQRICDAPRNFEGLKTYLATHNFEGIVWHHPDGRMVKIKRRDFWGDRLEACTDSTASESVPLAQHPDPHPPHWLRSEL